MADPTDISMVVSTTADLGTVAHANAFLDVLDRHGIGWLPQRIGTHEPLRQTYDRTAFISMWMQPNPLSDGSDVMYYTSRKVGAFGWVNWRRAWNQSFNSILISMPQTKFAEHGSRLLDLTADLLVSCEGEHACIRSSAEHGAQHQPTGRGPMLGLDLAKHVPGVYYANFFGPTLTDFVGYGRLESCPAVVTRAVGDGWLLTTANDPSDWNTPGALDLKKHVRQHLGDRLFFDVARPDRSTIAPFYDFARVRIGERPARAAARSAGQEFFAEPSEARAFVERVLEWSGRLRERVGRSETLDFSPDSLIVIDDYADALGDGDPAGKRDLGLEVAAYFGEVVRRNLGGAWTISKEDPYMPSVMLKSGEVEYPLVRTIKLLDGADRLSDWYGFLERGGGQLLR